MSNPYSVLCTRKQSAEDYPKNLALLRLVEKTTRGPMQSKLHAPTIIQKETGSQQETMDDNFS